MAFFGLFKTKAEKRAYAIGRQHERQSCKKSKTDKACKSRVKTSKEPKAKVPKVKANEIRSLEEKYLHHLDREGHLAKYGLKWGSPQHMYSAGYNDGVALCDNAFGMKSEFGKASGELYSLAYEKGKQSRIEYFKKTGKQLDEIIYER